jgi:hypothetical protein
MRVRRPVRASVSGVAGAAAGGGVLEAHHEYLEWRYAQVVQIGLGPAANDTCLASGWGDYSTPVTLACAGAGNAIAALTFASYGAPSGDCTGGFVANASCDAPACTEPRANPSSKEWKPNIPPKM